MTDIQLRLYNFGGLGQNLGKLAPDTYAKCYIDSSKSNLTPEIEKDQVFLVEGLDGSGKNRAENHVVLAAATPAIFEQFPPGKQNVLLYGGSGGTGSVAAPLAARWLLQNGHSFFMIRVASDQCKTSLENSIKTTKSLEAIIARSKLPIVECYHEHFQGVTRADVDSDVVFDLEALSYLLSGTNHELDSMDLRNLQFFHKVSPLQPQLASMSIFNTRADAMRMAEPIAVASLHSESKEYLSFGTPFYSTVGRPHKDVLGTTGEMHFVVTTIDVEHNAKAANDRLKELEQAQSSYRQRRVSVDIDDKMTEDDIVL